MVKLGVTCRSLTWNYQVGQLSFSVTWCDPCFREVRQQGGSRGTVVGDNPEIYSQPWFRVGYMPRPLGSYCSCRGCSLSFRCSEGEKVGKPLALEKHQGRLSGGFSAWWAWKRSSVLSWGPSHILDVAFSLHFCRATLMWSPASASAKIGDGLPLPTKGPAAW